MNVDKNIIEEALNFYEIDDRDYLNKCYDCIDSIDRQKQENKIDEILDILYGNRTNEIGKLWKIKKIEDLFDKDCNPFITSVLVLMGYTIHKENMKNYQLDLEQISIHKKRVKERLLNDIYKRKYKGIRVSEMVWATYFINMKLIEVGRLQYEFANENPITETKEACVKIHIPKEGKLDNEDVKESLNHSKELIKKYFNLNNPNYYCKSWVLSNQIRNLLGEDSNIIKFSNMFNIVEGEDCIKDILNFIFELQECENYKNLNENTSLQQNVKKYLLEGNTIYLGIGTLKKEILYG